MLKQWKKTINKIQKRIMIGVLAATFFVSFQPQRVDAGDFTNNFFIKYDGQIYKYQKRLVDIQIDGDLLQTGDMPAILMTGSDNSQYTMVPVREVFEAEGINAKVEWVSSTKDVIISYQDKVVKLTIDSDLAYINNEQIKLDAPAKLIQDMSKQYPKTMLPLRFVSENLGFKVDWDQEQYIANILTTTVEEAPSEPVDPIEPEAPEVPEVPEQDDVTQDINQNSDEQLDSLTSSGATRTLPTALAAKPIVFKPISTSTSSGSALTGSSGSALSSEVSQEGLVSATNEINAKELPLTSIYQVAFETTTEGVRRFVIKANEGISKVESSYWNGKLV
ncbi:MAG: copper amine oxidase N-terminal domain-containing protein, partial [Vallitaleaceae bacterium]|nr:copper amine oxidase N-terminal domain-containing protein [Vallitaleaceae bacterium]